MSSRRSNDHLDPWRRSPEFRAIANAALSRYNEARKRLPRCGAKRKSDGEPCQNIPLENGRCKFHGGRVPKGAQWHKVQLPRPETSLDKMSNKLRDVERRKAKQTRRRAGMNEEEAAAHARWQSAHSPGPPGPRARRRQDKAANLLLQGLSERARAAESLFTKGCATPPSQNALIEGSKERSVTMIEHVNDMTPTEALDALKRKIKIEGARKAVEALISVCDDPKAPAPAKATAGTSLLRAAGLFDKGAGEEASSKELHEMTAEELSREIARITRSASRKAQDEDLFS